MSGRPPSGDEGGGREAGTEVKMSKQAMREETERLIREAMDRKALTITQGETRIEATCGKCGEKNRVSSPRGQLRVTFSCKECGHQQTTL
jgi:predicted RNA-binding Zn-ribbon protein involved in translation (DUF1610 family)